jgi:uroporphyrinogen-III decarboxylase
MILEVMLRRIDRLCALPALDGIHLRDDWGTQEALMISPRLWRSFFRPAYARLFQRVRDSGKHVWFHSDGAIHAILPDLIDLGVQVLNPQVNLLGREPLAVLCRGKVCIQADIDRQWALPHGTPGDVRAEVRADLAAFGSRDGGYIARGEVAGDVPLENVRAMLDEMSRQR